MVRENYNILLFDAIAQSNIPKVGQLLTTKFYFINELYLYNNVYTRFIDVAWKTYLYAQGARKKSSLMIFDKLMTLNSMWPEPMDIRFLPQESRSRSIYEQKSEPSLLYYFDDFNKSNKTIRKLMTSRERALSNNSYDRLTALIHIKVDDLSLTSEKAEQVIEATTKLSKDYQDMLHEIIMHEGYVEYCAQTKRFISKYIIWGFDFTVEDRFDKINKYEYVVGCKKSIQLENLIYRTYTAMHYYLMVREQGVRAFNAIKHSKRAEVLTSFYNSQQCYMEIDLRTLGLNDDSDISMKALGMNTNVGTYLIDGIDMLSNILYSKIMNVLQHEVDFKFFVPSMRSGYKKKRVDLVFYDVTKPLSIQEVFAIKKILGFPEMSYVADDMILAQHSSYGVEYKFTRDLDKTRTYEMISMGNTLTLYVNACEFNFLDDMIRKIKKYKSTC